MNQETFQNHSYEVIKLKDMTIGKLNKELYDNEKRIDDLDGLFHDALQLIVDLLDPECPSEFREVAVQEYLRLREDYFI